jgi:hypothetical protein
MPPTATPPPTPTPKPTGEPVCLLTITGSDGKPVAKLCITSGDMAFDSNQNIAQGAGFMRAEPGKFYHVIPTFQCGEHYQQLGIGLSWLEWDDNGKTLSVRGLEPIIDSSSGDKYEITSDLEHPLVEDGILKITIKDKGDFSFKIEFDGNRGARMVEDGCPFYKEPPQ